MKTSKGLLGFLLLAFICVHLSSGLSISREKEDETPLEAEDPPASVITKKSGKNSEISSVTRLAKKTTPPKKPLLLEKKKTKVTKIKISELKPCISKAFCEVNAITKEPTFETSKEFFLILNRLKRFRDEEEREEVAVVRQGSGSAEDEDYSGSSEEGSYERERYDPYMHGNNGGPQRQGLWGPPPPGYYNRRGKALGDKNGNGTKPLKKVKKILTPAQIEKRDLVSRKTKELNVIDDLAALIKISAEIGQALRSPRRCRSLFKKCQMSYDEIIRIFNKTQSVEKAGATRDPLLDQPESDVVEPTPIETEDTPSVAPASQHEETPSEPGSSEGLFNRHQKSRTEFSEEDPDYLEDEAPVKTYSLFSSNAHDQAQKQRGEDVILTEEAEAIVDEAFKKFESAFPPKDDGGKGGSKKGRRKPQKDSEEEDESNESGSAEEQKKYQDGVSPDSPEVEMDVPPKKIKGKGKEVEQNEEENDSDAEILSSEIGNKREEEKKVVRGTGKGKDSSEEDDEGSDEQQGKEEQGQWGGKVKRPQKKDKKKGAEDLDDMEMVFTREDDESNGFNTYGFYPQVSTSYKKKEKKATPTTPPKKEKKKKKKGGKKNKKKIQPHLRPQDDQGSSEEEKPNPNNPEDMPPQDSPFYQALKLINGGKGADAIPDPSTLGNKKPGKGQGQGYQGYQGQGQGGYQGSYQNQEDQPSGQGSFFQSWIPASIKGLFSWGKNTDEDQTYASSFFKQQPGYQPPSSFPFGGPHPPPQQQQSSYGSQQPPQSSYGAPPQQSSYGSQPPNSYNGYPASRYPGGSGEQYGSYSRPQGRGDESSEEAEDEEEDEVRERNPRPQKREVHQQQSGHRRPRPLPSGVPIGTPTGDKVRGPPPPLIIVPLGEESNQSPNQQQQQQQQPRPEQQKKPEKNVDTNSEENESRENSSEEEKPKQRPTPKPTPSKNKKKKPVNENIFADMFPSPAEIDRRNAQKKKDKERENSSLLLNTFDSITNTFSTSADKVTDWSEEDNAVKKVHVASLHSPGNGGKYTVRRRSKPKPLSYTSHEVEEDRQVQEEGRSSEEEDKK